MRTVSLLLFLFDFLVEKEGIAHGIANCCSGRPPKCGKVYAV